MILTPFAFQVSASITLQNFVGRGGGGGFVLFLGGFWVGVWGVLFFFFFFLGVFWFFWWVVVANLAKVVVSALLSIPLKTSLFPSKHHFLGPPLTDRIKPFCNTECA